MELKSRLRTETIAIQSQLLPPRFCVFQQEAMILIIIMIDVIYPKRKNVENEKVEKKCAQP